MHGKLIVIDGGDGSGKATQAELLIKVLEKRKVRVQYIDFPRYDTFFGALVGRYLKGEFGPIESISPYLISLAYAADRGGLAAQIKKWLSDGTWVISNRYTSANFAHQGAKFASPDDRAHYWKWLDELEYGQYQLPREDLVIYLDVPPEISQTLISKKDVRTYLGVQAKDDAEKNLSHQIKSHANYHDLLKLHAHWRRIDCVSTRGGLRTIADIHTELMTLIDSLFS
ncbi:MAG: thymidylate kinase [bacterium]